MGTISRLWHETAVPMWAWVSQHFMLVHALTWVVTLTAFILGVALIQQSRGTRFIAELTSLPQRVRDTSYWESAAAWAFRRAGHNMLIGKEYFLPNLFLIVIVAGCAFGTFAGAEFMGGSVFRSSILGAPCLVAGDNVALHDFQMVTLAVGGMAFLGAFVWVIKRLVERVNNNDVSPATYYFLSARILTACLVAGVARYVMFNIDGQQCGLEEPRDIAGLAVLGFVIGLRPYFWLDDLRDWVIDKYYEKVKRLRPTAQVDELPERAELTVVEGLSPDRIERFAELDIDNCQKLSRENPLVLWLRTTYSLLHIIDWMGQAYFRSLLPNAKAKVLVDIGVRDIFSYRQLLSMPDSIPKQANIDKFLAATHVAILDRCPTFLHLQELVNALRPVPRAPSPPSP